MIMYTKDEKNATAVLLGPSRLNEVVTRSSARTALYFIRQTAPEEPRLQR